jgi:regulator of protease activity HflC (stomatin/prohibitin superfamily)
MAYSRNNHSTSASIRTCPIQIRTQSANGVSIFLFLIFIALGVFLRHPLMLVICALIGFYLLWAVKIAKEWERAIILRFGKYIGQKGPGFFMIVPIVDDIAAMIDMRIIATDFSAEQTLTSDNVPVFVDAIVFWHVWDAEKAALEVENYPSALILSAQTALREMIGKHDLAELLSERDKIGQALQQILGIKTDPWGIKAQSVEIRDVQIPQALEDAMSKQAQAERERQARIILGTAETEIAEKFSKASKEYHNNTTALHLRAMNMLYESLRDKSSMVIVPSSAIESMNLGTILGATALKQQEIVETELEESEKAN